MKRERKRERENGTAFSVLLLDLLHLEPVVLQPRLDLQFPLCHFGALAGGRVRGVGLLRRAGEGDEGGELGRTRGGRPWSCLRGLCGVPRGYGDGQAGSVAAGSLGGVGAAGVGQRGPSGSLAMLELTADAARAGAGAGEVRTHQRVLLLTLLPLGAVAPDEVQTHGCFAGHVDMAVRTACVVTDPTEKIGTHRHLLLGHLVGKGTGSVRLLACASQKPGADGNLVGIVDVGALVAAVTLAEAVVVHAVLLLLLLLARLVSYDGQTPLNRTTGDVASVGGRVARPHSAGGGGGDLRRAGPPPRSVDGRARRRGARQLIGRHPVEGPAYPEHAPPSPVLRWVASVLGGPQAALQQAPGRLDPLGPPGEGGAIVRCVGVGSALARHYLIAGPQLSRRGGATRHR